jgi:hypothetical protein
LLLRQLPDFAMQSHIFHTGLAVPVRHERRNESIVGQQAALKCSCQNEQRMNFSEIRSRAIFEYFEIKDYASYSHHQEEEEGSELRIQGEILSKSVHMSEHWHTKSI